MPFQPHSRRITRALAVAVCHWQATPSRLAIEAGCRVSIDSDAHYVGQRAWVRVGCERAFLCGVTADRIVNALPMDDLLAWTASHEA